MTRRRWLAATVLLGACRDLEELPRERRAAPTDGLEAGVSREGARPIRSIAGFQDPESVRYDAEQDVFFVSNIAGFGSLRDDNGHITRISAGDMDASTVFVAGGRNGVTLHAPKGMAIQGDTLWVTDIDVVRGFHRRTGAPVATIDFAAHAPVQLNDIALGADGTLRVTDTGIHMVFEGNVHVGGDRVFEVGSGRAISVVAAGPQLKQPNGIAWDSAGARWLLVTFDPFVGRVAAWSGRDSLAILHSGKGKLDGVEPLPGGGVIYSSWADSSIHVFRGGRDARVVRELPEPADIGIDTRRGRVLIPLTVLGQVQVWSLGRWWTP